MSFPARAAAGAWVGQAGDRPRDVGLPAQGGAKLHVWCWEVGRGSQRARADGAASKDARQGLLRAMKRQDARRAAEDEGLMARASLAVALSGDPTGLLALAVVGEAVLLVAARPDEEVYQAAARPV
jgi:hypothetical protein